VRSDRFVLPVFNWPRAIAAVREYPRFFRTRREYRRMGGSADWSELFPQLEDRLPTSPYDAHYFFQDVWAAQRIAEARPARHVDVGSRVDYVGFLTAITEVTFVDIRPLEANVEGLTSIAGSVLDMPFEDRSLESVSSLHVAEHIGLGRYGDPLDPDGTRKAAAELQRVVADGGRLLFSGPVGRSRTMFNAHRVHAPEEVLAMFPELELVEFSGVDDSGAFKRNRELSELAGADYACGMFLLKR
jgi:SAM-dependent methyltransferase